MVSQFVSSHNVQLLGALKYNFPEGTHAIGRLDQNSEGLLLLTTDKKITRLLFQGKQPHSRKYLVQVKNIIKHETIDQLARGIAISAPQGSQFVTSPCKVCIVQKPDYIADPLQTLHPNSLHSWLEITLTEGRFHQVRKMVAAVHHKCIRLIRIAIEDIHLGNLQPGEVQEVSSEYFFEKLKL